ncbi:L-aspartate oxidase [Microbacterium foliorum]|uniref:L-aspartate oxidase n=1 Tax=Microbacterium foliorum TaxID=104336 RepID=UPI001D5BDA5E|nr:FAD-dependent oxidoreductase [Microbacterium foliorum]CAH0133881.1 L-aspartate oxidase [Microbacterium foliorum]CAH0164795.1 L-aspartate oxidase [Microbacterium foliorum]
MEVIVAGSGIAGLTAALHAHEAGHTVTVVTKGALGDGCTGYAQGGVAGSYGAGDSAAEHAADTMTAGGGLSDPAAVDVLVHDATARIAELIARGVAFDRSAAGALLRGREAAHGHARIVHAGGDATGAAITRALVHATRAAGVAVIEHAFLVDLLVEGGVARGIRVLIDGTMRDLRADAVIVATGGAGQLYAHTTNPAGITGDGIAAALRAGVVVRDLEFVQFHPTVLLDADTPFLVSEAVRGEGATLLAADGRRFVFDSHPDGELAPRDVVSRAIARQAAAQGSPVRLDATMLGAQVLARRFPTIDRVTRERGFDWAAEPIPVTPAAHYLMGGIVTDLDGRTSLPQLLAVGEVARTGVHGANRLASNSLLEGAVFGARAAAALDAHWPTESAPTGSAPAGSGLAGSGLAGSGLTAELASGAPGEVRATMRDATDVPAFSRAALQQLMWDRVGLLRSAEGLEQALDTLDVWRAERRHPATVAEHEEHNLLLLGVATATAALTRTDSVGAHFREPAPSPVLETV